MAKSALAAVEAVAATIQRRLATPPSRSGSTSRTRHAKDHSLAGGTAGLAVFYAYLSQTRASSRYEQASLRLLQRAGDALASVTMEPSLYLGFPGVAWATAHLRGKLFDADGDPTEAVDEVLADYVNRPGWQGEYDLISGLVGLGLYALERLPDPGAARCLEGIIDRLEETAESRVGGITWHTPAARLPPEQRKLYPRGYYNLGLAHGVPGVIYLLGAASAAAVQPRKVRKMLSSAVDWMLHQKVNDSPGARFPAWVADGVAASGCRSAWCYGDPGVAAALLCAARCVGDSKWEREALEIARGAATREPDRTGVVDAGLCHGAAGLAHAFNRMYQATGDTKLRRAARYWFERTLAMRLPDRGVGGFSALASNDDGTKYWDDDLGILTGASGVALALLAASTSIEPEWDRMLLLSVPRSSDRRRA